MMSMVVAHESPSAIAAVPVLATRSDVLWLGEVECHETRHVGGKAAQLSRLAERWNISPGFSVTAAAFQQARGMDRLPEPTRAAIERAYADLGARVGQPTPPVAVRSSAIDEDGHVASFAGQHETILNVVGIDAVMAAIEACWESFRTERALAYRERNGLTLDDIRLSVLVQLMVPADVSGVVFSIDPVTGDRSRAMVTASWGLGESIVGGAVTPDTWVVSRDKPEIVEHLLGEKRRMTVAVPGGVRDVDVPRLLRQQPSLTSEQVREVVDLAVALEREMGWPVDVEFAFAGGRLYLLQCRPITTLITTPTAA
jgi:phosphoenolpyruvate synthase/pyruvate phosphate dikinase